MRQNLKVLPFLLVAVMGVGLAGCERHGERAAAKFGGHEAMRAGRGEGRGERHGGGIRKACEADIEQFCAADQTGRDRRQCLESHLDKLSAACKTAVEARKNHKRDKGSDDKSDSGSE
jgi:Cysteine rich repeat